MLSPHAAPFRPSGPIRLTIHNVFDYLGHVIYDQTDSGTIYSTIIDISPNGDQIEVKRKKKIKLISITNREIYVFKPAAVEVEEPGVEPGMQ